MSFGTGGITLGVELPRFTYANDFNPFQPASESSTLEPRPTFTGKGLSDLQEQFLRLREEYGVDDKTALQLLDITDADNDDWLKTYVERQTDPNFLRETLALKNEFEAERLAQAAPYNLMYQIPRTLTQAAILPATVALGSAKTATDALARMGGINITGGALNPNAGGYF